MSPTKQDARVFLRALQDAMLNSTERGTAMVRPVIKAMADQHGIPEKRCLFLLGKWEGKGWYEYGTVIDGGWLTAKGKAVEVAE